MAVIVKTVNMPKTCKTCDFMEFNYCPHWIPCSDRLPKKEQECLVCRNGIIRIDKFIGRDIPCKWNLTISDYDAWMPLPDPYKGES